ncbi:hopanoid biosynthesis-associated RND transporter HpnN [Pseudolabrys taiwanensis]|uniref:Hopanoid biosynthesis-associated RND transporter HpnN n=1 Tax=Pseudolabrys taiwanensis TaxID=331696 RepID=A0A346A195_9HYPH|nr:MMPL family transporter [Pseudolabrys taiwanensis]AXK82942.1 hopanoid biosynthesis-associated RND transporter HpnN [Pseudolabrys taiwanensis]
MLVSTVRGLVGLCTRFSWFVIALGVLAAIGSGVYTAKHFAINTNIDTLISPTLDWRQREAAFERDFPGHFQSTLIVIDAPTPELASAAAGLLAQKLSEQPKLFESVDNLSGNEFFARNGLLFQPTNDVEQLTDGMSRAAPLIGTLARDPSLRGLTRALSFGLAAVQQGMSKLDDMVRPMSMASDTLDNVLAGKPAVFSWQELLSGHKPTVSETRRFIEVRPVLDFSALEPGKVSSDAIRKAAADLDLSGKYQARVRLTGQIPMGDEEFATVQEGALINGAATVVVVLVILWLALKSGRIILAVFVNLVIGLAITAALGLMMVGALNVISVAFAVLFVGLGVDFGIQFSVRYRSERHAVPDLRKALSLTASEVAVPLTLAAVAVACGFLSFLPTAYRGVSELGMIAGAGMMVAYLTSITVLPALLTVLNPPGEPEEIGYRALAPVDDFLSRHRVGVVAGTIGVAVVGAPLLYYLTFDFDPVHLRSTQTESISTLLDVQKDPNVNFNSINVIVPSLDRMSEVADRLRKLPEVSRVATIDSYVPQDQEKKLQLIKDMDDQIGFLLRDPAPRSGPSDAENVAALNASADQLKGMAGDAKGPGADAARRLAADLVNLAKADKATRDRAQDAFVVPLQVSLAGLRGFLGAQAVTRANLPDGLKRQWVTADGKSRVEVFPSGDANDTEVLRKFARAVLTVYPEAIGGPVSILKSGETVVSAFIHAGLYALLSIAILLWIVLRRFGDMLLTLVPLVLAGVVTLEICVLIGMPLNFANIIALPLLLGVGVAFKIYYITAWRAGQGNLLQSSLTRAVIWSALTTATAFGSLWLSNHPGTSSMGKLLALSLVTTLCAAVLFQPALMGAPRDADKS